MSEKKKKAWAENFDCEDWGGYMAAKKAKLEEQFKEASKNEFENTTNLFNGIAIFVNGYTNPSSDELKILMMKNGGVYHHYLRPQSTTHLIASNLPYSKILAYRKAQKPLPLCKPEWITDSIKFGKLQDYRNYLLYSQSTKDQPQITAQFMDQKSDGDCNKTSISEENSNTAQTKYNDCVIKNLSKNQENSSAYKTSTKNQEFLSEFYNNSRLHHIATMGATFKDYIIELRSKSNGLFPGLEKLKKKSQNLSDRFEDLDDFDTEINLNSKNVNKVIMHIDMDCFFVSVGLRNNPEFRGYPVVVTHAKINRNNNMDPEKLASMSEIASCSYEAREAGISNGMHLGEALKLCPNLKTIKYDFEAYKEVSYSLYDTVASYTLEIEAVSCDEMYADCTSILNSCNLSPVNFASILRNEINEKTGCPVSAGFGENKLQARLATKKAKPDGQFYLKKQDVKTFMSELKITSLPGVGWSTSRKLREMKIETCSDLEKLPKYELQKIFGKKNGEQLFEMCRGIDNSKLDMEHIRKSVSAEVNYGIRFENDNDAKQFLEKLSYEVSNRVQKSSMKGSCITLKVMIRAKEAPLEPRKFMGHGLCDVFNKSKNLIAPTNDPAVIFREVLSLWKQIVTAPQEARGIGIQISKLESTKSKAKESNILKFIQMGKIGQSCSERNFEYQEEEKNDSFTLLDDRQKVHLNYENDADYSEKFENKQFNIDPSSSSSGSCMQTKQVEFFKETKPSSSKFVKVKRPDLQDIDMQVLLELPEDIRNEILSEYKTNSAEKPEIKEIKKQAVVATSRRGSSKNDRKGSKFSKPKSGSIKEAMKNAEKKNTVSNTVKINSMFPVTKTDSMNEKSKENLEKEPESARPEQDAITDLVNCFLELPVPQVRLQIQEWVANSPDSVNDVDFLSMANYFGTLPKQKRLEDLHILLKSFYRYILKSENCLWHKTYRKTIDHVQKCMCLEYTVKLMVPENIDCDKCKSEAVYCSL